MQVKKFEARTMKEALELVKRHLGPEAIILSAKDNSRSFGLAGQASVEVTAAISEETLRKKKLADSKMTEVVRQQYEKTPARLQKQFIEKANRRPMDQAIKNSTVQTAKPAPPKSLRYVDILDDEDDIQVTRRIEQRRPVYERSQAEPSSTLAQNIVQSEVRVKSAAQRAFQAMNDAAMGLIENRPKDKNVQINVSEAREAAVEDFEIKDLKSEILNLRKMIEGFQKMPQSFVTMHPGAEQGVSYELSPIFQKLLRSGVSQSNALEILKLAQAGVPQDQLQKTSFVDAWVAKYIMDHTQIADDKIKNRFQLFLGPSGQGKTSTLVKMASHMVINEKKKIAIATTDTARVGSTEQLRIYAQILNVPFAVIRRPQDWQEVYAKLGHVETIFVDFPGLNLKTMQEVDAVRTIFPQSEMGVSVHYVQSVLSNEETAFEIASRYQMLGLSDVIFTGLDESSQHGTIYNFQKQFKLPLHSFGVGRQIPEDLERATKERVVDLIFKLTKFRKDRVG